MGSESVAVVVVTYNSADLLPDLVDSLEPGLKGVDWHLVVADNASSDGSAEAARRLAPDAIVVETGRNGGYAAGINAGVAAAGPHTAVLILNPDVRLLPGCVQELLTALRRPGTGVAVPHLVDGDGELIETMRREPTLLRAAADAFVGASRAGRWGTLGEVVTDPARYARDAVTDWAEGSTVLVGAECWAAVGPWDESYFLYSEETDFELRARDAGLVTRYVSAAHAVHLEGDSGASPALWPLLMINRVKLYAGRHGAVATAAYWACLVLREGSRALLGKRTSRAALRALVDPRRLREERGPHSVRPV